MDRHADVFFRDEDAARFAEGRLFLIDSPPDGMQKLASASPFDILGASGPMRILPTTDQYRRIREREECDELRRTESRTEGEWSCFALHSLPYVYDGSNDRGVIGCLQNKTDTTTSQEKIGTHLHDSNVSEVETCCIHESIEPSERGGGDAASERGLVDDLITTAEENEKADGDESTFQGGRKKLKLSHSTEELKQPVAPQRNRADIWPRGNNYAQARSDVKTHEPWISSQKKSFDLNSEESKTEDNEGSSRVEERGDESISTDCGNSRRLKRNDIQEKNGANDHGPSICDEKHNYDLCSEQSEDEDDVEESSEEGISDDLISMHGDSVDDNDGDEQRNVRGNGDNNRQVKTFHSRLWSAKALTPATSSDAIGSSINKLMLDDSRWHSRRSESEVVLSRIKRNRQRSLLKRPRGIRRMGDVAAVNLPARRGAEVEERVAQQLRRTTLRFAAAPVVANKRKKQMSLKSMFKKK